MNAPSPTVNFYIVNFPLRGEVFGFVTYTAI